MNDSLNLTISTPASVLVDSAKVQSIRAEDESGGFGILPGHADLLTVLPASVVRWRERDGVAHFCALKSGVLTVTGGHRVAIACREGAIGDDLPTLEAQVQALRAAETDADRRARVEQMRLHARAVRQLMHYLRGDLKPLTLDGDLP
ncbi:F0F1 ATP synthase subunit epsilon [Rhodoblastus sp.]|jgi:F-type H+-transporting ATPase subunit epsilon|uniref:F0F1 ATP synthase subunit epsilon n=1 Tax=Rhodoblastus sp. TaxID=1962975 RepID=UPI0025F72978|nr:F0F1 ATP synthase subunit epsilon [Rhodoblastus sp.]